MYGLKLHIKGRYLDETFFHFKFHLNMCFKETVFSKELFNKNNDRHWKGVFPERLLVNQK